MNKIKYKRSITGLYPVISSSNKETPSSVVYIAASNSNTQDKEKADIVLDGQNDAKVLNTVISNMSSAKGGTIYLFAGDYIINTLKEITYNGVVYKYGLYFPHERGEVTIEGVGNVHKYSNVSFQSNFCGVTIKMGTTAFNSIGENDKVSLIGVHPQWVYSLGFFQLKKLGFYIPDFNKPVVIIDGKFASEIGCEQIFISTGANVADSTTCNPKCIGVRGCNSGNNGRHYAFKYIKICGVGTAFHLAGEHLIGEQLAAQRCKYGYVFGDIPELDTIVSPGSYGVGQHNLTIINSCFEYVHYGITFGTNNTLNAVTFIDFNIEEYTEPAWPLVYKCRDVGGGWFRGIMNYFCMPSKGRMWNDIQNGQYFKSTNMVALKIGSTSSRPTDVVEIGYPYFDTTLDKMVFRTLTGWSDAAESQSSYSVDTSAKILYATKSTLSGSDKIQITTPNIKNHYEINFRGLCVTTGKLSIIFEGQALPAYHNGRIDIDGTNITTYDYKTLDTHSYAHGLSISGLVVINIKTTAPRKAKVTISTGSEYSDSLTCFEKEIPWNGCGDNCIASVSDGGSYTDCYLSIGGECFLKDIWIFGDSWTDHWPLYAYEIGCNNYMLDGNSGRNSVSAYQSFVKDIEIGTPSAVIWMMGMNDPDTDSAVNSNWLTNYNLVKDICISLGIEFIACTIANTPDRNNYFKNNYIRESGDRYIELSQQLGCSDSMGGSYGYDNILAHDGTHVNNTGRLLTAMILSKEISYLNK